MKDETQPDSGGELRQWIGWSGPWRPLVVGPLVWTLLATAVLVVVALIIKTDAPWRGHPLGVAGQIAEYCERNRMECLIRQPLNTWSNMIYWWLGLIFFGFARHDREQLVRAGRGRNFLLSRPGLSAVFGLCSLLLCFGSFLYHASLLYYAQKLDMAGTYAATAVIFSYAVLRHLRAWWKLELSAIGESSLFFGVVFGLVVYFNYLSPFSDAFVISIFPAVTLVFIVLYWRQVRTPHKWRFLLGAFLIAQTASLFRELDVRKIFCWPDSLIWQGHALWHVLTGLGLLGIYLFFRTESYAPASKLPSSKLPSSKLPVSKLPEE